MARAKDAEPTATYSWLSDYTTATRQKDTCLSALVDQMTHDATDVTLHFDGRMWRIERVDADGVGGGAYGVTLMDALNAAIPDYRRARRRHDEKKAG